MHPLPHHQHRASAVSGWSLGIGLGLTVLVAALAVWQLCLVVEAANTVPAMPAGYVAFAGPCGALVLVVSVCGWLVSRPLARRRG
jgi:hypothetical protein